MNKNENQGTEEKNKNQDGILFTIKEVSNVIEETPNVVRNWIKELKQYIPLQKNESGYNVFDNEALERMKLIKELHRDRNYSVRQIEHYFATNGEAFKPTPQKSADELLAEELNEMKNMIKELQEDNKIQRQFNEKLVEKLDNQQIHLDNQQKYIDEKLKERDSNLVETMRSLQESAMLVAPAKEQEKKGFFARLFK